MVWSAPNNSKAGELNVHGWKLSLFLQERILSYLLGDGSNVDSIQNHVHDLATIMNRTVEAVAQNEESLQFAERLNAKNIVTYIKNERISRFGPIGS